MRWTRSLGLFGLLCFAGCPARVSIYAPRMTDTPDHRQALERRSCLDCHEPAKIPHHTKTDDCGRCHVICKGC